MRPELTDSRRLTGANLFWDAPSAIIDASFEGDLKISFQAGLKQPGLYSRQAGTPGNSSRTGNSMVVLAS